MDLIFNMQNPQLLNWSLLVEEIFQVHGQNVSAFPRTKLNSCSYKFQASHAKLPKLCQALQYQTHVEKYRIFSRVLLRIFSELEILV